MPPPPKRPRPPSKLPPRKQTQTQPRPPKRRHSQLCKPNNKRPTPPQPPMPPAKAKLPRMPAKEKVLALAPGLEWAKAKAKDKDKAQVPAPELEWDLERLPARPTRRGSK